MKLTPNYLEYFISPVTGQLSTFFQLPSLTEDYVWEGGANSFPFPSPVLIDMRLTTAQLQNQVDQIASTNFIIKTASSYVPNSQSLDILSTGVMINTAGVVSTSDDYVQNTETSVIIGNIAIFGDASGKLITDGGTSIPDLSGLVAEAVAAAIDALNSANNAATSASDASNSATESAASAIASAAFKTAAETAATSSASSASAALLSAAAALSSADNATIAALDAHDSASAAYTSSLNAASSASSASSSSTSSAASATSSASSAASASSSELQCEAILSELYSTGIVLTGDVIASGSLNSPIITTLNMTLNQIPLATSDINANLQKIVNVANGSNPYDAVNYSQLAGGSGLALLKANNLSDVASASTSRTNLGLTNVAIQSVTQHAALVGGSSNAITSVITASANQLFVSAAGGDPFWTSSYIDYGNSNLTTTGGNLFAGTLCGASGITNSPKNTGLGIGCLSSISISATFDGKNTGGGYNCLHNLTTGSHDTAWGNNSSLEITTATFCSSFGDESLAANQTTSFHAAMGASSLESLTGGAGYCSGLGYASGSNFTNYTQCTFLGAFSDALSNNFTNATAVGYGAIVTASNTMMLGNGSILNIQPGSITCDLGTSGNPFVNLFSSGVLKTTNTTASTSTTTGSGIFGGGIGVAGSAYIGGSLNVVGNIIFSPSNMVYVSVLNGSDTTGNGCSSAPYATITHALLQITTASATNPFCVSLDGGAFSEAGIVLKPNISIQGNGSIITNSGIGLLPISLDSTFLTVSSNSFFDKILFKNGAAFTLTLTGKSASVATVLRLNNLERTAIGDVTITGTSPATTMVNGPTTLFINNCFNDLDSILTADTHSLTNINCQINNSLLSTLTVINNSSTASSNSYCNIISCNISTLTLRSTGTQQLISTISGMSSMPSTWTIDGANSIVNMYTPYNIAPTLVNSATFAPTSLFSGIVNTSNSTASTSVSTGALIAAGGLGIGGKGYFGGALNVTDTTQASSVSTGSIIGSGGLGIAKKGYFGGAVSVTDTTASSSTTTGSGIFSGGVGVAGSAYIGSNINCAGTLTLTPITAGSVIFAGASGVMAQNNTNFFWDNTNNRLGIGTATPTSLLTLNAASSAPTVGSTFNISGSTQSIARMTFSGQEFFQSSNTSTDGIAFLLGVNRSASRQLWITDSSYATNSTNPAFRVWFTSASCTIGTVSTDGTVTLPITISSSSTNNVCTILGLNSTSNGSGVGVFCIGNTSLAPSTNPSSGGILYVQSGALKYRGSSGTVTTLAAA